jgi:hypothetical protein
MHTQECSEQNALEQLPIDINISEEITTDYNFVILSTGKTAYHTPDRIEMSF